MYAYRALELHTPHPPGSQHPHAVPLMWHRRILALAPRPRLLSSCLPPSSTCPCTSPSFRGLHFSRWGSSRVGGRPHLQCPWDADYLQKSEACSNVLTLSGLWYTGPHEGRVCLSATARRDAIRILVTALARPPLAPLEVLAMWASLPFLLLPPGHPPPQPPTVTIYNPQSYMPPAYALATAFLVRGLTSWWASSAGLLHLVPDTPSGAWLAHGSARPIYSWSTNLHVLDARQACGAASHPSCAGVALLTAVPPGDAALALPWLMTPYNLDTLRLYTTAGLAHRWALMPAAAPTD